MNEIYFFSGTGNSLQIANDIAAKLGDSKVNKIADYKGEQINSDTLGIVFPVYMWGAPLIVVKFLEQLQVSDKTYIYLVTNYGRVPGKALDQCKELLEKRNIVVSAGYLIQMPGNYIIMYGAFSQEKQTELFRKEKEIIKRIAEDIQNRKISKIEKSHVIFDRLFTNMSYSKVKQFPQTDTGFTVNDQCIGCGKCASVCPVHNIKLVGKRPEWQHHCERCLACLQNCPQQAINYGNKTQNRERYLNPIYRAKR